MPTDERPVITGLPEMVGLVIVGVASVPPEIVPLDISTVEAMVVPVPRVLRVRVTA
jgi:hypothetical protein